MTPRRMLWGGLFYALLYVVATTWLPRPDAPQGRQLLALAFLLPPVLLGLATALRAARAASRAERAFWGLLAGAALAQVLNELAYGCYVLMPRLRTLHVAGLFAYDTYFTLVVVALLVRPDRPLGPAEVRPAALDFTMALLGAYFLVFYFILIPSGLSGYPWFLVYTVQETVPALLAIALALRVRHGPFRTVYRLLAFGFGAAAVVGLPGNWAYAHGQYQLYSPLDLEWMLPFFALAAAALSPTGPAWVRPLGRDVGAARARLVTLTLALPALLDLGLRGFEVQPELAEMRSHAALVATALMAILVAFRLRQRVRSDAPAQSASVPASDFLSFAAGAAHEMNNPLMAVAGWAELATRRPGAPQARLGALLASVRQAADAVGRLQKLAHGARDGNAGDAEP